MGVKEREGACFERVVCSPIDLESSLKVLVVDQVKRRECQESRRRCVSSLSLSSTSPTHSPLRWTTLIKRMKISLNP